MELLGVVSGGGIDVLSRESIVGSQESERSPPWRMEVGELGSREVGKEGQPRRIE